MSAQINFYFTGNSSNNSQFRLRLQVKKNLAATYSCNNEKLKNPIRPSQKKRNMQIFRNIQWAQHPSAMPRAMFLFPLFMLFTNRTFLCFPTEPRAQKPQQQQCNLTQSQNPSSNTSAGTLTAEPGSAMQRRKLLPTSTYMWNNKGLSVDYPG